MQADQIKITVVEDDVNLRFLIVKGLESKGYKVSEASDGVSAEILIMRTQPHIVLMDWMMPEKNGAEVCASLRAKGFNNMIIMITAKSQDVDKIMAYTSGVTDYITKPFSMDLLLALLESKVTYLTQTENIAVCMINDVEYHAGTLELISASGKTELTVLENRILAFLYKHRNADVLREDLMTAVWGFESDMNTRTLDMHIVRLRKKIEQDEDRPQALVTIRGKGFRLNIA